jgi:hypothetical protein
MSEPIKHSPGPFWESGHCLVSKDDFVICTNIRERDDYRLLISADHAPHVCANPKCPGDINRRKLKLFGEVAELVRRLNNCRDLAEQGVQRTDLAGSLRLDKDVADFFARAKELS